MIGIDPKGYRLLLGLFKTLSDRGEVMDFGRDKMALKAVAWLYLVMSCLMTLALVLTKSNPAAYLSSFLFFSGFLLLSVLLSETGNSLINPVEGLVLAHQPVNGATYTAAKLTHLVRIVAYLMGSMNVVPALAGLVVKRWGWWYPFVHLLAAFAVGLVAALCCCALFGWLMRLVPVRRLKAAGQLAAAVPMVGMIWWPRLQEAIAHVKMPGWLAPALGIAAAVAVAFGIRSLSADYLIRVSSIMHAGSSAGAKARRSRTGSVAARFFGGQPARAGFAFVSRMMLRDWQFRRQLIPLLFALAGMTPLLVLAAGWRVDPFSGRFTPLHLLPHIFGAVLFFVCIFLPYSSDYKGAWIFLTVPAGAFGRFARGIHALLWIWGIVIPHGALLPLLVWFWGPWHAVLFVVYSAAAASFYLALELRAIDGAPFTKQADPSRGAMLMPMMLGGGAAMAAAVGVQYYFLFRSPALAALAAAALAPAAYFLTRSSVNALEVSIRYNLALTSAEAGTLYREVDA